MKANGMWAFAFIKNFKEIILSKDRYGKKPLYYFIDDKNFIISSEIKVIFNILKIPRKVNINYLNEFLLTKRWPRNNDNQTFYKDIHKLEAGQILNFDTVSFKFTISKLDSFYKTKKDFSKQELKNDLLSSIKIRLRADVKIGILLSGGIDSSLVAYLVSLEKNIKDNITFYTIEELGDDLHHASLLSKYLEIKLKKITIKDKVSNFIKFNNFANKSAECLEMPLNYRNFALTSYSIFEEIKKDDVRVILEGSGGDEIFSCYENDIKQIYLNNKREKKFKNYFLYLYTYFKIRNYPNKGLLRFCKFLIKEIFILDVDRNINQILMPNMEILLKLIKKKYQKIPFSENLLERSKIYNIHDMHLNLIDKGHLKNFLIITDAYSMMNSIEVRSPFLDYRLVKYIYLPLKFKFYSIYNKYILRKIFPDDFPKKITWRRAKVGFSAGDLMNITVNYKSEIINSIKKSSFINEIFDKEKLNILLNDKNIENNINFLEILFSLSVLDKKYNLVT